MSHTKPYYVEDVMKKRVGFIVSLLLATLCFDAAFAQVGQSTLLSSLIRFFQLG